MANGCISLNRIWKIKIYASFIDTYSRLQWASALSSKKADSIIIHLLEAMVIVGIPIQTKSDNALAYVSIKMKQFFCIIHIKHIIWILHNPTGQAIVEIPNHILKEMHFKQKGDIQTPPYPRRG